MCIYISVAKPYGHFGQKLESLQAGQERTGQGKTWQGRAGGQIKSGQSNFFQMFAIDFETYYIKSIITI